MTQPVDLHDEDDGMQVITEAEFHAVRNRLAELGTLTTLVTRMEGVLSAYPCGRDEEQDAANGEPCLDRGTAAKDRGHAGSHRHHGGHHHHGSHHGHHYGHGNGANRVPGGGGGGGHPANGFRPKSTMASGRIAVRPSVATWHRPPAIQSDRSPPMRKVMAALNKLTERNYDKILAIVTGHLGVGIDGIASQVLEQSVRQSSYAPVFVRMMGDLKHSVQQHGEEQAELFGSRVDRFCSEFLEFEFLSSLRPTGSAAEYDEFCERCLTKARLMGRCRTVLHLLGRRVSTLCGPDGVMEAVIQRLQASEPVERRGPCEPEPCTDLLLDMAIEYRKVVGLLTPTWEDYFRGLLGVIEPAKSRFKIMDLLGM